MVLIIMPTDKVAEMPAGTIYTCPMYPEVQQDHPGNCPKCGMSLEGGLKSEVQHRWLIFNEW